MAVQGADKVYKAPVSAHVLNKRERQRADILAAARGLLVAGGVDAVTLAAVAAELGLTKQALYHYFPRKEALLGALVSTLLEEEVQAILGAVAGVRKKDGVLGVMIEAFYRHYIGQLDVFRAIYCQGQLTGMGKLGIDETLIRNDVNPRTRGLFDVLEERLSRKKDKPARRAQLRRLAFSAWLAALGLLTMLGLAQAGNDPLVHSDEDLLRTLKDTFNGAAPGKGD